MSSSQHEVLNLQYKVNIKLDCFISPRNINFLKNPSTGLLCKNTGSEAEVSRSRFAILRHFPNRETTLWRRVCLFKKIICFMLVSLVEDFRVLCYREIDEEALEQALTAAVTCTILAAAGPQRSRVLATLYKVC